jgi:hypothetical protein
MFYFIQKSNKKINDKSMSYSSTDLQHQKI